MILYFDFDGTISDSGALITQGVQKSFAAIGWPEPPAKEIEKLLGSSLEHIFQTVSPKKLDSETLASLTKDYQNHYKDLSKNQAKLFPGMLEVLKESRSLAEAMAIVTNKRTESAKQEADILGITPFFNAIIGADSAQPKPDPALIHTANKEMGFKDNPKDGLVIGDSPFDMEMAKNAGLKGVAVAWGRKDPELLLNAGAEMVVSTPQELMAFIKSLLPPSGKS